MFFWFSFVLEGSRESCGRFLIFFSFFFFLRGDIGVRGRMHFQGGSSECWPWGRPLGESWEHSPEQGNLGRKTKVWEVLTLTVQASQPPPPPPLPQKLLRPTPYSQATGPLPPAPAGLRHLPRVHAQLSAKRHRLRPFPAQAHTHPGLKLVSTSPAPTPSHVNSACSVT